MIERRKLKTIMREQSLELAGIVENDASKVGQLAGADKIITGSLMQLDGQFVVLIKLIDVASGEVDVTEGIKVNNESKLEKGIRSIVSKMVKTGREKWGAGFATMKVALTELEDLREKKSNPVVQQYIVSVTPTVQNMKVSFKTDFTMSIDVLSALSSGVLLDFQLRMNHVGFGILVNFGFPVPGTLVFSYGFDFKYYPVDIAEMILPYLNIGYLMTMDFDNFHIPLIASVGIRVHPIPGWNKFFIDGSFGYLMNIFDISGSSGGLPSEKFLPFVTAKAGWKF